MKISQISSIHVILFFYRYFWKLVVDRTSNQGIIFIGFNQCADVGFDISMIENFCGNKMITRGNRLFSGRLDASKFLGNGSNGYIYACLPQNLFDGEGHPRIRNIPMERHFSRIYIRDINDFLIKLVLN